MLRVGGCSGSSPLPEAPRDAIAPGWGEPIGTQPSSSSVPRCPPKEKLEVDRALQAGGRTGSPDVGEAELDEVGGKGLDAEREHLGAGGELIIGGKAEAQLGDQRRDGFAVHRLRAGRRRDQCRGIGDLRQGQAADSSSFRLALARDDVDIVEIDHLAFGAVQQALEVEAGPEDRGQQTARDKCRKRHDAAVVDREELADDVGVDRPHG